jgi:dihydroorotase (multifunctional complex type)
LLLEARVTFDLDLLIANGLVSTPGGAFACDVGIRDEKIVALYQPGTAPPALETIDAPGLRVLPGFVDVHFHATGLPDGKRENMTTGTAAAAAGGTTTLCQMPVWEPFRIRDRAEAAESQAHVDFGLWGLGGATKEEIFQAADDGAIAFKMFMTGPMGNNANPAIDRSKMMVGSGPRLYEQLKLAASTGRRVGVHCEDQAIIDAIAPEMEGRTDPLGHQDSRPAAAEISAAAKMLALAVHFKARVHVTHVTCNGVVALIAEAKRRGLDVSAETCIHYLCFDSEIMRTAGPFSRITPPIRSAAEADELWPALRDGVLDMVSSDHSPHLLAEKLKGWESIFLAPNGAPGVELRVPAVLTAAAEGQLSFDRAVETLSAAGAKAFDMYPRKGAIAPGSDADLVLFDPTTRWNVKTSDLITGARDVAHMFEDMPMVGRITRTILRGRTIYLDGNVVGPAGIGRQIVPNGVRVAVPA